MEWSADIPPNHGRHKHHAAMLSTTGQNKGGMGGGGGSSSEGNKINRKKKSHVPGILPRRELESLLKAAAMEVSMLGWPSPAGSSGRV